MAVTSNLSIKRENMIERVVKISRLSDENSDLGYWKGVSPVERIKTLEQIRKEYNNWKYSDAEQRFQRVYTITKLASG